MRTKRIFSILPLLFVIGCECSFINSVYPRFKAFDDGGDPGEPLFLTTYIENGDIDKVNKHFVILAFQWILLRIIS